jgi:hypothetical protein
MGAFIASNALSLAAPDKDALIAKEKAIWQAFKDKKADEVKKLVSTDLIAVYPDAIYNFQQRLESMSKIDMKSFFLSDLNVVSPDAKHGGYLLRGKSRRQRWFERLKSRNGLELEERRMDSCVPLRYAGRRGGAGSEHRQHNRFNT